MADSGREQIVEEIRRRLDSMSLGTGCHYDYQQTLRWRVTAPTGPFPVPVLIDEDEEILGEQAGIIVRRLRLLVAVWHSIELGEADAPARAASWMIEDVEKTLMSDRRCAGLAIDTNLAGSAPDVGEAISPNVLCSVSATVTYRTNPEDPTDVR